MTVPCPVCDSGKIPIDFDFHPYSGELECPYCKGEAVIDLEDPEQARAYTRVRSIDPSDPEFQAQTTALAIARAKRNEEATKADLHLEACAAWGGATGQAMEEG